MEHLVVMFKFVNPLIVWLWIGAGIYIAGGLLAWSPLIVPEAQRVPVHVPAAAEVAS